MFKCWYFDVKSNFAKINKNYNSLISLISSEERMKLKHYVYKKDRYTFLLGRIMIRKLIHTLTKISMNKIKIHINQHGKPYFTHTIYKNINFNISHHNYMVVVVFSNNETITSIGCDVLNVQVAKNYNIQTKLI